MQTFSWLPVDDAAKIICDVALSPHHDAHVYHVENPIRQSWADITPIILQCLGLRQEQVIDYNQWISLIKDADLSHATAASPLLDFFENDFLHMACGGVILDTSEARKKSAALSQMLEIPESMMSRYVESWKSS